MPPYFTKDNTMTTKFIKDTRTKHVSSEKIKEILRLDGWTEEGIKKEVAKPKKKKTLKEE